MGEGKEGRFAERNHGQMEVGFLHQPLQDILVIVRDTGTRNISEVYRMRIEHIDWHDRVIFNPKGKTPEARRSVPMSDRVLDLLMTRCAARRLDGCFLPISQKLDT